MNELLCACVFIPVLRLSGHAPIGAIQLFTRVLRVLPICTYIRAAIRGALDFSLLRNGKCQWLRLYLATQLIVLWQVTSVLLSFLPFLAKTETDKPNALNKFVENLLENWTRTMANQEGIFVDETFHCAHHNRICHSSFFFFFCLLNVKHSWALTPLLFALINSAGFRHYSKRFSFPLWAHLTGNLMMRILPLHFGSNQAQLATK